jgi:hypothetical protein
MHGSFTAEILAGDYYSERIAHCLNPYQKFYFSVSWNPEAFESAILGVRLNRKREEGACLGMKRRCRMLGENGSNPRQRQRCYVDIGYKDSKKGNGNHRSHPAIWHFPKDSLFFPYNAGH